MGTWLKRSASKKKYVFNHEHESMDQILEGLFKSDQPDKIKETFVARVCEQGTQGSQNESTVKGILQVSSKWILNGTTTLQVKSGFNLFESWGIHNRDIFLMFFTPNLAAEMLTHGYGGMAANVPLLLREGFRVMSHSGAGLDNEHVQVVQSNITKFVCSTRERVVVRNVSLLLREFTECIPSHANEKTNFCVSIIHHLSVGVPPEQGQVIPKFVRDTDDIAFFLNVMWTPHPSLLLDTCLATIFHIISTSRTDEMSEPAICLAAVVKHIPIEMANRVVKDVVTDKSITDVSLEAAVGQIVEWLKWPTAVNVDMWLLCFLSELAKAQKYTLLVRIIEANAEQVAETLAYPGLRYAGFKVLSQMLLGFHHSPGPFHKCLEKIPIIVHVLRNEGSAQSGAFLKEFSELIYDLMYQHTGFPELYEPVLELIKDFPQPSVDEIKIKLNQIRWLSQAGCISVIETATPSLLVSAVKQEKLELGKAGLENLGNTCYMNSVLQALYMCDQFRRGVLSKTPTGKEGLLVKLQHVFAQLSQSSRPAIAPSKFLQSSRPPWFLPGHQQDCSEFLKYLLDQLHEDEKSSSSNVGMQKSQSSGSLSPNGTVRINNTGTLSKAERKKAVVTLTSLKMKTDDDMNGVNGSAAGNLDTDKCSESVQSLIERTFRGKVQTTLRCLACQQISSRVESFADIPLAFPNSSRPVEYLQKNLAGGNDVSSADVPMESTPPEAAGEVDLPKPSDASFDLSDLISFYLKPEKLTGDNKYHCDQCGKLQDGERSIQIVESPQYLILTLLRFSYDTKLQTRTKIFQDVHYPRTLAVPVCDESSVASRDGKVDFQKHYARSSSCANPRNGADLVDVYQMKLEDIAARLAPKCESTTQVSSRCHLYGLTSVIVHSGASSECGHYYCYARHSQTGQVKAKLLDKISGNLDNLDLLSDRWYSFNDSRVSHATFDSFSNVTKKFSKDTPYVLIYRKLAYEDQALGVNMEPALRPDLRDAVIKDNETYLKEQELEARAREEQRRRRSSSVNSANLNNWQSKDDDDDDSHKGHPGYTNGLGSGLDITGSRFVF